MARSRGDPAATCTAPRPRELRKGLLDWSPFVLAQHREAAGSGLLLPEPVPRPLLRGRRRRADRGNRRRSTTQDRPGLIVVHGLFSIRRFDYVREIAVRAYFDWGFNVAAIDLRSFGAHRADSATRRRRRAGRRARTSSRAGRYLKELGATSVGALGISLGASSVLGAAHLPGAEEALDGGILAISASRRHAPRRPSGCRARSRVPTPPTRSTACSRRCSRSRVRAGRWPEEIDTLVEPIEALAAPYYGVSADEIWGRSSARNHIAGARVPVLVLHPEDDQIIPVEHARMLDEAQGRQRPGARLDRARGRRTVRSTSLDRAGPTPCTASFFERWAGYGEAAPLLPGGIPRRRGGLLPRAAAEGQDRRRWLTKRGQRHPQTAAVERDARRHRGAGQPRGAPCLGGALAPAVP